MKIVHSALLNESFLKQKLISVRPREKCMYVNGKLITTCTEDFINFIIHDQLDHFLLSGGSRSGDCTPTRDCEPIQALKIFHDLMSHKIPENDPGTVTNMVPRLVPTTMSPTLKNKIWIRALGNMKVQAMRKEYDILALKNLGPGKGLRFPGQDEYFNPCIVIDDLLKTAIERANGTFQLPPRARALIRTTEIQPSAPPTMILDEPPSYDEIE